MNTLITITSLFAFSFFAQTSDPEKTYFSLSTGLNSGLNKVNYGVSFEDRYNADTEVSAHKESSNYYSLGGGFNVQGSYGFMLSKNLGVELGVNYLVSDKHTIGSYIEDYQYPSDKSYETSTEVVTMKSSMIKLIPSLLYTSSGEKLAPYAKVGLVAGFGKLKVQNRMKYEKKSRNDQEAHSTELDFELKGGVALGLNTAVGVTYKVGNAVSLFGEASLTSLSYAPTSGVIRKAVWNGEDQLPKMFTNTREVEFVDEYTDDHTIKEKLDQPGKELKTNYSFASVGFNLGVKFDF